MGNPTSSTKMALDIMLAYEDNTSTALNFTDLQDGVVVRKILENFVTNVTTLKCSSKRKYLSMFDSFMKFLLKDPLSPEKKND